MAPVVMTESSDLDKKLEDATDFLKRMIHVEKVVDSTGVEQYYDDTADVYENAMANIKCYRYEAVTKLMTDFFPDKEKRADVKILDLAAGTGIIGVELAKVGFKDMYAVDASEGMLKELDSKNVYRGRWKEYLGTSATDPIPNIEDDSYDVVIICGGFAQSHCDIQVFHQAHRALKKGGIFINAMSERFIKIVKSLNGLEPLLFQMEKDGKWKVLVRMIQEGANEGLLHLCRKL